MLNISLFGVKITDFLLLEIPTREFRVGLLLIEGIEKIFASLLESDNPPDAVIYRLLSKY
jgi:hypothetical protein